MERGQRGRPGMAAATRRQRAVGELALCLSGGGYRAALFHLGGLTRLDELGVPSKVDTITSVSGGSIAAAHLVTALSNRWPAPGDVVPDWQNRVADPFWRARVKIFGPVPCWSTVAVELAEPRPCRSSPRLAVSGVADTDAAFGTAVTTTARPLRNGHGVRGELVFDSGRERGSMGYYRDGYVAPSPEWPLALVVAAPSCFPPVFTLAFALGSFRSARR